MPSTLPDSHREGNTTNTAARNLPDRGRDGTGMLLTASEKRALPPGLEADQGLTEKYAALRRFYNQPKNRWYKPLSNSDVALFADQYVKFLGTGPFNKTQLLMSR